MYRLDHDKAEFAGPYNDFFEEICQFKGFSTEDEFNLFCKKVLEAWPQANEHGVNKFNEYLEGIEEKKENTISTPWGGVFITKHEHPLVEKFLVVKGGHYLSFEKHDEKEEHLEVFEGEGVLLQRKGDGIAVRRLYPGVEADFAPGEEHCIIAPKDLLIFEKSLDHKGMDKDLVFLFNPS
ncbi:MAG: hypothetical protein R3B71_04645 [Candidatus Gracilibacteria bacterium]|nr:hypothetical protein [Candidatus Peregrinibacteria bacterium]